MSAPPCLLLEAAVCAVDGGGECGGWVGASLSSAAPTPTPSRSPWGTAAGRELVDLWKTPPHSRKKGARRACIWWWCCGGLLGFAFLQPTHKQTNKQTNKSCLLHRLPVTEWPSAENWPTSPREGVRRFKALFTPGLKTTSPQTVPPQQLAF